MIINNNYYYLHHHHHIFIFFRYCDLGYPIDVKFIDLQAMRYGSCVLDVMHVLFTSSRPKVQEKHLEILLFEYYVNLCENAQKLDETLEFSYDEFKNELKEKLYFGVFVSCLMFTCITKKSGSEEETPDLDYTLENLRNEIQIERTYKTLSLEYHERIRRLFLTLTDFNLI